mgnify:CR=1 FL=1
MGIVLFVNAFGQTDPESEDPVIVSDGESIVSQKDEIELVEDSSVGEAVKRRPDLGFANVTIDGEDSNMSLDSISADSVESVEVLKAVTPELDADSRGGSVNLKSKAAYEQERVRTQGNVEYLYNPLFDHSGYDARVSVSGPVNKKRTIGGRFSLRSSDTFEGEDRLGRDWRTETIDGVTHTVLDEFGIEVEIEERKTVELSGGLDWKVNDALSLFVRGMFQDSEGKGTKPKVDYRIYHDEGEDDRAQYESFDGFIGEVSNVPVKTGLVAWESTNEKVEAATGFLFESDRFEIDGKLTYQDNEYNEPEFLVIDFVKPGVDIRYDITNSNYPTVEVTNGVNLKDPSLFLFEDYNSQEWRTQNSDLISALNAKWNEAFGVEDIFMKFGVKRRVRERDQFEGDKIYDVYAGIYSMADVVSNERFSDLSGGRYSIDAFPDYYKASAFGKDNADGFTLNESRTRESSAPNTYTADEEVDSLYAMMNWDIGKFRSVIGWRHERTSVSFRANEVLKGTDVESEDRVLVGYTEADDLGGVVEPVYLATNPRVGESTYGNDFPNAHFRYKWTEWLTLIGSFTNTIERPDYESVVPYRRIDHEDKDISEGNPGLKPTLYTNWDFSFDIDLGKGSALSVELFDRRVKDLIFDSEVEVPVVVDDGSTVLYELRRSENSSDSQGKIQGFELTLRQAISLGFVPDGFSWNINYMYQDSEVEYLINDKRLLLNQTHVPKNSIRATLNFENERFFVQLKYSYKDTEFRRVAELASDREYEKSQGELDLNLNYRINKNVRLFADFDNITEAADNNRYEGDESKPTFYRFEGWTGKVGFKFDI